jgi:hypothetical protein
MTAHAIAVTAGLPIWQTSLLEEVGAGELEGVLHEDAAREMTSSHEIWLARGDLDAIPGAESGDSVQARAVAVLHLAWLAKDQSVAAVTHAALLRSLVNTASGTPRTDPVDVDHDAKHFIDASALPISRLASDQPWSGPVHRFDTANGAYVVKQVAASDKRVPENIQRLLARAAISPDPALAAGQHPCGEDDVIVQRFVSGTHVLTRLDNRQRQEMVLLIRRLDLQLDPQAFPGLGRFADLLTGAARGTGPAAHRLTERLQDTRTHALAARSDGVFDIDLHRENILWNGSRMVKIDFELCCSGPRLLGLASALALGVHLYEPLDLNWWLNALDIGPLDADALEELRILAELRLLMGQAFFERAGHDNSQGQSRRDRYHRALDRMKKFGARSPHRLEY